MLKVLHYIVEKPVSLLFLPPPLISQQSTLVLTLSLSQWSQLLPADSRDAETHRWWWADWREMIARWKEDEKLSGFVEEVEKLVVEGGQD
jgi:hypothetical protein